MVTPLYRPLVARSPFGWPIIASPHCQGLAIEDNQYSLYFGAECIPEMRRKIQNFPWAQKSLRLWKEEAESILPENVDFGTHVKPKFKAGLSHHDGTYLLFDPSQHEQLYHPVTGEWIKMTDDVLGGWVHACHERYYRLMNGMSILYALTGDARYSQWVWNAFRDAVRYYGLCEDQKYSVGYDMAFIDARNTRYLLQSMELVKDAPGGSKKDLTSVETIIFERVGNMVSRWLDVMRPFNMVSWGGGTLAAMGKYMKRKDWLEKAVFDKKTGLQNHLTTGVPRDPKTGKVDGFWFETSIAYSFFSLAPLIGLYRIGEQEGAVNDDLRERFNAMFEAPLHFIDPELRFVTIGERMAVGAFSLPIMRHIYEYAAGQVDAKRYGPILSMIYHQSDTERTSFAALAYGPDQLPSPCKPPKSSAVLPVAKMATFRGETPEGNVTCWFLSGESNNASQAHQNHDKLSISLHAHGKIISSDLGLSTHRRNNVYGTYLNGTFSHNTLLVNEKDQGPLESLDFDADLKAKVPWAHGKLRGDRANPERKKLWEMMIKRGDDVAEDTYDGVTLERTVYFDPPYIILVDRAKAPSEKRFGFVFHALGSLLVRPDLTEKSLTLPPLPDTGPLSLFTARTTISPVKRVIADWRIQAHLWLRAIVVPKTAGEITWGRTPSNPSFESRGTILLRTVGIDTHFVTALEIHSGNPTLLDLSTSKDTVKIMTASGERIYTR